VKVRSERDFLDLLQDDLLEDTRLRSIEKFLETTGDAVNIDNELPVILEELWDICEKHRIQIIILEKSAFEFPELAEVYDTYARRRLLRQLESYLSTRIRTGAIRRLHSVPATARFILESVAWFGFKQQGIASGPIYSKAETLPDLAGILARGLKQDWRVKNTCDLEERD
jgi:hypothetical protein